MTDLSHYFNQQSIDPSQYFGVRGMIDHHSFSLQSAKGLFSATAFDLGTRILLKHFKWHQKGDTKVLDLGCGYGLISSFLAYGYTKNTYPDLKKLHIDACDSSPLAVDVTTQNLMTYKDTKYLSSQVLCSDVLSDPYFSDKQYDVIVTNPPFSAGKKTVFEFIQQSYDHLVDGGILRMVVPTNKGAKSYVRKTQETFGEHQVNIIALEAGYRVRTATK